MRRSALLLLTCVLALAAGLTLLRLSEQLAAPTAGVADANGAVVRRFYDAVNTALSSGEVGGVEGLVADDFKEHSPLPGVPPTRAGLLRYLLALHAVYPTMRLEIEDLVAGEVVMTRLRVERARRGSFLGLSLSDEMPIWHSLDAFRVVDGRITEHWGGQDLPVLLEPHAQAVVDVATAAPVVALARLRYAPLAQSVEHVPPGPLLLSVETGSLTVALMGRGRLAAEPADRPVTSETIDDRSTELRGGESLVVPARTGVVVRSSGSEAAVFLAVAIVPASVASWTDAAVDGVSSQPPAWWPVSPAPGSRLTPLATSAATGLGVGAVEIGIGRVTLAPTASLSPVGVSAPVWLAVEEGILGLALTDGPSRPETSDWCKRRFMAGQTWPVPAGTRPVLRNAGTDPLVVLILTLSPAGAWPE